MNKARALIILVTIFCAVAVTAKLYLDKEVHQLVEEELTDEIGCKVSLGSLSLSFLRPNLSTSDFRIKCEGEKVGMHAEKVTASVVLGQLFDKRVIIDNINISGLTMDAPATEGAFYETVKWASAPLGSSNPDRWIVKVNQINIKGLPEKVRFLYEDNQILLGDANASIQLKRNLPGIPVVVRILSKTGQVATSEVNTNLTDLKVKTVFAKRAEIDIFSVKTEFGSLSVDGWIDTDTLDYDLNGGLDDYQLGLAGNNLDGNYQLTKGCYASTGEFSEKEVEVQLTSGDDCEYFVAGTGVYNIKNEDLEFSKISARGELESVEAELVNKTPISIDVSKKELSGLFDTEISQGDFKLIGTTDIGSEALRGSLFAFGSELPIRAALIGRERLVATLNSGRVSGGELVAEYGIEDEALAISAKDFSLDFLDDISGNLTFDYQGKTLSLAPFSVVAFGNEVKSEESFDIVIDSEQVVLDKQRVLVAGRPVTIDGVVSLSGDLDLELSGDSRFQRTILASDSFISARADGLLKVQGSFDEPLLFGEVELTDIDGSFSYLESALVVENARADISFTEHEVHLSNAAGLLNTGSFTGEGKVVLQDFAPVSGSVGIEMSDISLTPLADISLVVDGQLLFKLAEQVYGLSGNLDVTNAVVRKDISWRDILGLFIEKKKVRRSSDSNSEILPVNLSVNVGLQELLVEATVLVAELVGDIQLGGTSIEPKISGEVLANGGQISFSSYPFEIVSGRVFFDGSKPQLEVLGETSIPSTELGEEEIVWLTVSGSAEDPRISLRSELGSDERTLLARISSGASGSGLTLVSNDNSQPLLELFDPTTSASIGSRLSSLVRFEEVRIETNVSSEEGRLDPWLAASRPLIEDFSLSVKSSLSGTNSGEASVEYYLAPELSVIAGWQSTLVTQRANTDGSAVVGLRTEQRFPGQSLFPDFNFVEFSELSGDEVLSNVSVDGNRRFSDKEVVRLSGLTRGTALSEGALSAARNRILEEYASQGFMFAGLSYDFNKRFEGNLTNVSLRIEEGEPVRIESVVLLGDSKEFLSDHFDEILGKVRSESLVESWKQRALEILRNNEYYFARIATELKGEELVVSLTETEPVKLEFVGLDYFSRSQLIEVLELNDRNTPVPAKLDSYIDEVLVNFYQDEGFLKASVKSQKIPKSQESQESKSRLEIFINEGEKYLVSGVSVLGVSDKQELELLSRVKTSPYPGALLDYFIPGVASYSVMRSDQEQLEEYLKSEGYPRASVELNYNYVNADRVEVEFLVDLAEKTEIKDIECQHDLELKSDFTEAKKEEAESKLTAELAGEGYPLAQVDLFVKNSVLYCDVNEGPRVIVSKIVFDGVNQKRAKKIVRKFIEVGDFWKESKIADVVSELVSSGGFSRIEVRPYDGKLDEAKETLLVKYSLRETGSLRLGGGFSSEEGVLLSGQLAQRNFYGTGNTFGIGVDGAFLNDGRFLDAGTARMFYSFPPNLRVEAFGQFAIEFNNDFSYDRVGAAIKSDYQLTEDLEITPELVYSIEDVFDVPAEQLIGANDFGTTAYLEPYLGLRYDLRDDVFNTSKGLEARLSISAASTDFGSDVDLIGGYGRLSGWIPLSQRITLGASVSGEIIEPYGETDVVPLRRRLFLGGRGSVRGFSPNSLAPRARTGRPVGGDASLQASVEFGLGVSEDLQVLAFLDVGQAFLRHEGSFDGIDKDLSDLRFSPGMGLRYKTPVGPISIEYGLALDKEFGEGFGRLFFGVGNSF